MNKVITLLLKRTVTVLVVVSFLLQPLTVLAEDVVTSEASSEQSKFVDSTSVANEKVDSVENEGQRLSSSGDNSYVHEQTIQQSQKKLPGTTGKFLVDNFSGAATYNYLIDLPSGRANMTPEIVLNYNSHNSGQGGSLIGAGWGLSQSFVTRINKSGTINLYNTNNFAVQIFGEQIDLVPDNSSEGIYISEVESNYLKAIYSTSTGWTVLDSTGKKYVFGDNQQTKQKDPDNQQNVYRWFLRKIIDSNSNEIEFNYVDIDNQLYPKSISYTKNGSERGNFEIRFQPFYDGVQISDIRPDIFFSYASAYKITTKYLLKKIEVISNDVKKSDYIFSYKQGQNDKISLLESIQKRNYNQDEQVFLQPKLSFNYSVKQPQYTDVTNEYPVNEWEYFAQNYPYLWRDYSQLMEFNGDAWMDRLDKKFDGKKWIDSNMIFPSQIRDDLIDRINRFSLVGDVNGDGKNDIIYSINSGINNNKMWLNAGDHFEPGWTLPSFFYSNHTYWPMSRLALVDVNNDGLADIINSYKQWYSVGSPVQTKEIWLNTGSSFVLGYGDFPTDLAVCEANIFYSCPSRSVQFLDVNNDGLVDVFVGDGAYLNKGNGFSQELDQSYESGSSEYGFVQGASRQIDVNSDGLVDVVTSYYPGFITQPINKTFINTGNGFLQNNSWNIPMFFGNYGNGFDDDYGVRIIDIDNDGGFDLIRRFCEGYYCAQSNNLPDKVYKSQPGKANLLKEIKLEDNKMVEVEYTQSSSILDEENNRLNEKLPVSLPIVKSIREFDGFGNYNATNYLYAYGHYYVDVQKPNNNQFAGFGVVTVENEKYKTKIFFHQGGGFDGYQFGEDDSWPLKGRQYREEIYSKNNGEEELEKVTTKKWKKIDLSENSFKVYLESMSVFDNKNDLTSIQIKNNKVFESAKQNTFKKRLEFNENKTEQIVKNSDSNSIRYLGNEDGKYRYKFISSLKDNGNYNSNKAGYVKNSGDMPWPALVAGNVGYFFNGNDRALVGAYQNAGQNGCENPGKNITRGYLSYDTSAIPDDASIASGKIMFNTNHYGIGDDSRPMHVVKWLPDDISMITNADYKKVGDVSGGSVAIVKGIPYATLQLNDYGKNIINVSTSTKLALRMSGDLEGTGPLCIGAFQKSTHDFIYPPVLEIDFALSEPYTLPTNLEINSQSNPYTIRPPLEFSAEFHAQGTTSIAKNWRIQIAEVEDDYSNSVWDSGKQSVSGAVTINERVRGMIYNGPQLNYDGAVYKWRVKFWDNLNNEGSWSTEQATFASLLSARGKRIEYTYDDNNQIIREKNLGYSFLDVINGVLISEIPGDEQTTNYEYADSTTDLPILNAVKQKTLSATTENVTYKQKSYYDQLPYGQVSKNNKTKDDFIVQQINQRYEYNNYGLPVKQIDPLAKETIYEYDAKHLYPVKVTNANGQEINVTYDNYIGQPTLIIDPNGLKEQRSYDAFGRVVLVSKSSPTDNNQMIEMERYSYDDYSMPKVIKKEVRVDGGNWLVTAEYYDGLGQNIQTRTKHNDNNEYVVVSNKYDNLGRVIKTTLPYLQMEENYITEDWNKPVTEKVYDALNRVTKEILPLGENNYTYDGFITTITDASGVQKKLERDAYDRLIAVEEFIDGSFVKTKYSYNVLGKLTKIVDSQNNEREFIYDDLGRLLSQTEAHKPNTTVEPWTYEYDQASRITKQTDPNGNQTTYDYDDLGRVTKQRTSAGEIIYEYDNGENAVGRLVNVNSNYGVGYQKHMNYDLWGRVVNEDVTINKKPFNSAFEYSLSGQVIKAIQPNQVTIENIYDNQGRFIGFNVIDPERQPRAVIKNVTYHLSGRPSEVFYANSTITNYDYDEQTQRLVNKLTMAKNLKIQSLNYQYDVLGNIIEINDDSKTLTAKKVNYDYDSLSRLIKTTAVNTANGADYEETYNYDSLGNILNKSDIGDYLYGNANPHQATTIGDKTYLYDRSGNVVNDGLYEYIYNPENRMVNANALDGGLLSEYAYDPAGTRVYKKVTTNSVAESKVSESVSSGENKEVVINEAKEVPVEPVLEETKEEGKLEEVSEADLKISAVVENTEGSVTTETYYPNSFYELMVVGDKESPTIHVYGLGQRLAQLETVKDVSSIKLIFTDHLGSTQQVTDDTGALLTTYDYYSFGGVRVEDNNDGTNKKGFIGKELDETKLNYVEARYLSASTGKFIQVDPVSLYITDENKIKQSLGRSLIEVLSNPVAMNAYAYGNNNPITNRDIDGNYSVNAFSVLSEKTQNKIGVWAENIYNNNKVAASIMNHPYVAGAVAGITAGAIVAGTVIASGGAITCGVLCGTSVAGIVGATANSTPYVNKNTASGNMLEIGQSFGRLGNVIQNYSDNILGYTRHALQRMAERGLSQEVLNETTKNPVLVLQQSNGVRLFMSEKAVVVLSNAKQVITTYGRAEFVPEIREILNQALGR